MRVMLPRVDSLCKNIKFVADLEGTTNLFTTIQDGTEVPRGVLANYAITHIRLTLIPVNQRASDDNMPKMFLERW